MKRTTRIALLSLALIACPASAAESEFVLTLRNHRFEPAELRVPAGQKLKLVVHNQDSAAEEFESHELNREKVIAAGGSGTIYVGPLSPGRYPFFGEFNDSTARGVLVAE